MFTSRSIGSSLLLLSFVVLAGCGGDDRPPLANASGKVTLDGEPVAGATVAFVPVEGGRPATAMTDASGVYVMNTYGDEEGAAIGEHFVSVMKVGGSGASMLENEDSAPAGDGDESATGTDSLSPNLGGPDGASEDAVDPASLTDYMVPARYSTLR